VCWIRLSQNKVKRLAFRKIGSDVTIGISLEESTENVFSSDSCALCQLLMVTEGY